MANRKHVKSAPKNSTPTDAQITATTDLTEQVRTLAYTLYERRGRQEGFAEQDWLEAEAEILGSKRIFIAA
jgi:hypothetical protein